SRIGWRHLCSSTASVPLSAGAFGIEAKGERYMVRVLIADDHPVFRFGLRTLLKADPAMEVVGEAVNGEERITQSYSLQPDHVLMDLNMQGMNGIDAIRRIRS